MSAPRWTRSLVLVLAAAAAATVASTASAQPSQPASCGWSGYSYAGLAAPAATSGIAASVAEIATPTVRSGHVAAWVGVGGSGQGPNGSDEWVQAGLSAFPDGHSELYVEIARPGEKVQYVALGGVALGRASRLAVLEDAKRPGTWGVWVDGRERTNPISLPGSHGALLPAATAESWDGGVRTCNLFGYRFDGVRVAGARGWQALAGATRVQDPGYRVVSSRTGFVARSRW